MKGFLSKMLPVGASIPDNEDDIDCSFAMEYHGPPVTYDLPRAIPVDIKRIPTASLVATASASDELSLPVVKPLTTSDSVCRGHSKEPTLRSESVVSPTSVIAFDSRDQDGLFSGLSSEISSSGMLGSPIDDHAQSRKVSDAINNSGALASLSCRECSHELSGRMGSSNTLEFSNSSDQSHKLPSEMGSSDTSGIGSPMDCKEPEGFSNDANQVEWGLPEPELSIESLSCESSSCKDEDGSNIPPNHARRVSVVTFCDTESSYTIYEEVSSVGTENIQQREEPGTKVEKGLCHRCLKGNKFTEKEACIVCNAKYCSNCVLSAMGSMPEGRKCVTCTGCPINESKRGKLGKCSKMLKRLLSDLEIQQLTRVEKLCEANQLQAKHVYVNGKQLCQEDLILLQSCPKSPTKLRPGRYWYDKISGLWGKEGQKPCKFISPHLNVGGKIMRNASNGNTSVLINDREITKRELRMLKMIGVNCAGNPHFWVDECGAYREEGQNNDKGNLWNKAGIKLLCACLSLPIPSKVPNPSAEEVNNLVSGAIPDYLKQRSLKKLLLVGNDGSGSGTIFKQAKILYKAEPFSEDELQNIKLMIQSNVYSYLGILLDGRERFEEENLTERRKKPLFNQLDGIGTDNEGNGKSIYSIGPRLKAFSDWLLKVMVSGNLDAIFPAASYEYAPLVEELWKDAAIQATFERRSELQNLPSVASYFLDRVVDISREDYEPSKEDILYAKGMASSNSIASMVFSIRESAEHGLGDAADQHVPSLRYQLIRVHAKGLGENCKWLEMFEDVRMVIYCVSLSDYDQFCNDGSRAPTNKMLVSRKLFEGIITHPTFERKECLLVLNKFDLLEEKIERVPLSQCNWFEDFNPVTGHHRPNNNSALLAEQASHYIAVKFKKLFYDLTGRKLYVSLVKGLERDSVDVALRYSREILKWDEKRPNFSASEYSNVSTEASSSL